MASTHGRKKRPLPEALTTRLATMGFVRMPESDTEPVETYRHPKHLTWVYGFSAFGMAGEGDKVIFTGPQSFGPTLTTVDIVCEQLERMIERAKVGQ